MILYILEEFIQETIYWQNNQMDMYAVNWYLTIQCALPSWLKTYVNA